MATNDSSTTESKRPSRSERAVTAKKALVKPTTSAAIIPLPLVVGLSILACLAVGSVMWFTSTEPHAPNSPPSSPENESAGPRGDVRSASQTIRAARRAHERSQAESTGQ